MGEDAAPGEMQVPCSGATLASGHPKDYVTVGCQLSTWPLELIFHPDDATDTCSEQELVMERAGLVLQDGLETFTGTEHSATQSRDLGGLTLLDQILSKQPVLPEPQMSSSPAPAEPQAFPHPNPATSQVPHLGSVLRTKGWLLVQLPVDPRASSWKTECVLKRGPRTPHSHFLCQNAPGLVKLFLFLPPALGCEDSREG